MTPLHAIVLPAPDAGNKILRSHWTNRRRAVTSTKKKASWLDIILSLGGVKGSVGMGDARVITLDLRHPFPQDECNMRIAAKPLVDSLIANPIRRAKKKKHLEMIGNATVVDQFDTGPEQSFRQSMCWVWDDDPEHLRVFYSAQKVGLKDDRSLTLAVWEPENFFHSILSDMDRLNSYFLTTC